MKYALVVLATLGVLLLLALVFPYTGLYDVAADEGHGGLEEWYLSTLSMRSIKSRAADVAAPADLADSTMIRRGAVSFSQMCQTCHGAPGRERSVTGQGMAPTPPLLSEAADEWEPGEVYWILEHGIKMAGMPAYGPTHSEEELWELVAFVEQLPEMTPERYEALTAPPAAPVDTATADSTARPLVDDGHDHVH
jgi:mono/diheme cytochrome c family protein